MFPHTEYYPHLMKLYHYTSRNIPDPKIFSDVLEQRMQAKQAGDKSTANALKLVVNTTYGAELNQYNALYDPLMGRSVCISGQLFLLELAIHLYKAVPDLKIVQLNTDGLMIEFDDSQYDAVQEIVNEWQTRTGFELEEDKISKIFQKDVNGYIEVQADGSYKVKGGYLVRGIAPAGAFNINNNASIVSKALIEYFVNGIPVEETINASKDILDFQFIAKAGSKYGRAFQIVDGQEVKVQNVNRVYAYADEKYGTLYKVKKENGQIAKIENLPEHCIIDNDNHLTIDVVDRSFYIDLAKKRINDFLGVKPEKKARKKTMAAAATKPMNVYQKLIEARARFIDSNPSKSGKNMHLSFMYFELEDIVPTATKIFRDLGLIPVVNFTAPNETVGGIAVMTIYNADNPEEHINFEAPFNPIQPLISKEGKQATNEMQAMGSSITYMRRYLYMMAMDIVEADAVDAGLGQPTPAPKAPAQKKAPATVEERKEIKAVLTKGDNPVSKIMLKGLVGKMQELGEKAPDKLKAIQDSLEKAGKPLQDLTKTEAEALMDMVKQALGDEK